MVIITVFHLLKKASCRNTIKGENAPPNPNKPINSNNGVFITGPGLELVKCFSLFNTWGGGFPKIQVAWRCPPPSTSLLHPWPPWQSRQIGDKLRKGL